MAMNKILRKPLRIEDTFIEPVFDMVFGDEAVAVTKLGQATIYKRTFKAGDGATYIPVGNPFGEPTCPIMAAGTLPPAPKAERLLYGLKKYIASHWAGDEPTLKTLARFVLNTWLYDFAPECFHLAIYGEAGTGKTRLLEVLRAVCYRACKVTAMTPTAVLFQMDVFGGTWLFDDVGSRDQENVLLWAKAGSMRATGTVVRCLLADDGCHVEPAAFNVWGPKVMVMDKKLLFADPGLASRCMSVELRQAPQDVIASRRELDEAEVANDGMDLWPELLAYRLAQISAGLPSQELAALRVRRPGKILVEGE